MARTGHPGAPNSLESGANMVNQLPVQRTIAFAFCTHVRLSAKRIVLKFDRSRRGTVHPSPRPTPPGASLDPQRDSAPIAVQQQRPEVLINVVCRIKGRSLALVSIGSARARPRPVNGPVAPLSRAKPPPSVRELMQRRPQLEPNDDLGLEHQQIADPLLNLRSRKQLPRK